MSDSNVADRLKTFIEKIGLSYSQFADSCGIPRPSLSQLLTGRNKKINDIMVGQIHQTFPQLSIVWLLFGEGPMEGNVGASEPPEGTPADDGYQNSLFSTEDFEESGSKKIIFSSGSQSQSENAKENGLDIPPNMAQILERERERWQNKVKALEEQRDILKKNPRKAVRIMVYYDDSTFEEFFPR